MSIQINPRKIAKANAVGFDYVTETNYLIAPAGSLISTGKGWLHLITPEGLACDCGKGLYCPLHLQFRLAREEGYSPNRGYELRGIAEVAGTYETRRQALDAVAVYYANEIEEKDAATVARGGRPFDIGQDCYDCGFPRSGSHSPSCELLEV
jgi:hypothetical protein